MTVSMSNGLLPNKRIFSQLHLVTPRQARHARTAKAPASVTRTTCRSAPEGTAAPPSLDTAAPAPAPAPPAPAHEVAPASAPAPPAPASAAEPAGTVSPSSPLVLSSGVFILPHPHKVEKGGEDWYFIAASQRAVGVADGVGGWAGVGIDAGVYARLLMKHACEAADAQASAVSSCSDRDECEALLLAGQDTETVAKLCAQEILESAYNRTDVKGSSTACIAVLNGNSLQISNLGDSGVLLMRSSLGQVMATQQQQHSFNFPFQVGGDRKGDQPHQAERYEVEVDSGDVIVLATDGLWDNCFNREIVSVLTECRKSGFSAAKSAKTLVLYAQRRAADTSYASPFAHTARKAGINFTGGKVDDITVVVAFVERAAAAAAAASSLDSADL